MSCATCGGRGWIVLVAVELRPRYPNDRGSRKRPSGYTLSPVNIRFQCECDDGWRWRWRRQRGEQV